ncbi:MAG: PilW family protein [Burkholderiales bacterium]|nr:PilW family protein [Burkholderiales bacterium]
MMKPLLHRNRQGKSQGGFSLIELMIAITLGLMILSGLTAVFVKNSLARTEIERSHRQLESGRYAMALLTEDLRMAGFFAAFNPYELIISPESPPLGADTSPVTAAITTMPDACATDPADLNRSFFFHIQGIDNTATTPSCVSDARAGSDILVIRRVATCTASPLEAGCDALPAGAPYFQSSNCYQSTELAKNSGGAASAKDYQAHFVLNTDTSLATKHALDCTAVAEYRRYLTRIYFVANNNEAGDGIPTLKRAELGGSGFTIVPLVEGIETLQFEYGVDANDDAVVDGYSADPSLANCGFATANTLNAPKCWLRAYAVKVNLLARNVEKSAGHTDSKVYTLGRKADGTSNLFPSSGTYADGYKRHAYNATVRLDNPSGRRLP